MATVCFCFAPRPRGVTYALVVAANFDKVTTHSALDFAQPVQTPSGIHVIAPAERNLAGDDRFSSNSVIALSNSGRFSIATTMCDEGGVAMPYTGNPRLRSIADEFMSGHTTALEFLNRVAAVHALAVSSLAAGGDPSGDAPLNFSIVVGDGSTVAFYCSSVASPPSKLFPGVHVLSNGHLNAAWPKCEWLRGRFALRTLDFVRSSFESKEREDTARVAPSAQHPSMVREENYAMCDFLLKLMCDRSVPLYNALYHIQPPPRCLAIASSAYTPPTSVDGLTFGTSSTVVAIVPAVGECLYAQRSMGAVHDSFARKDVVFLRVDDPSHPTADVTEGAAADVDVDVVG